ncbi:4-hydroxy-tetrahydrodipicolinate reductase [Candidatus Woesearchaeota archaeon]|nr:4-hydroxy-tetrahydrodipicolinate reductase [Candidatus Woesearchaeota archaeon]
MNIAIIGYGKMGRMVEQVAHQRGHRIVARVDPTDPDADAKKISQSTLHDADLCIEFTHPRAAVQNIVALAQLKKPIVVGTTGWYDALPQVQEAVKHRKVSLLYASNFSLGVQLYLRIMQRAAQLMQSFPHYDIGGIGAHHNQKADSPSGTAKSIASVILQHMPRKKSVVYELPDRPLAADEFHFASLSCGSIPGTHTVFFDSAVDTIELTHTARSREGFALGAVLAAEWLRKEPREGIFTIDAMMDELLGVQ